MAWPKVLVLAARAWDPRPALRSLLPQPEQQERLAALDGLRALALLWVLAYHTAIWSMDGYQLAGADGESPATEGVAGAWLNSPVTQPWLNGDAGECRGCSLGCLVDTCCCLLFVPCRRAVALTWMRAAVEPGPSQSKCVAQPCQALKCVCRRGHLFCAFRLFDINAVAKGSRRDRAF
jgi:hypothetical protein